MEASPQTRERLFAERRNRPIDLHNRLAPRVRTQLKTMYEREHPFQGGVKASRTLERQPQSPPFGSCGRLANSFSPSRSGCKGFLGNPYLSPLLFLCLWAVLRRSIRGTYPRGTEHPCRCPRLRRPFNSRPPFPGPTEGQRDESLPFLRRATGPAAPLLHDPPPPLAARQGGGGA